MGELYRRGITVPMVAVNNHTDCWCSDDTDTTYVLLTNVRVDSLVRRDDHATGEDLPQGVAWFTCGPYKLPVLRPAPMELPHIPGAVVYPSVAQQPTRKYAHTYEDIPPRLRVDIKSNTTVHVDSEWTAIQVIAEFMAEAIDSLGDEVRAAGHWGTSRSRGRDSPPCAWCHARPHGHNRLDHRPHVLQAQVSDCCLVATCPQLALSPLLALCRCQSRGRHPPMNGR